MCNYYDVEPHTIIPLPDCRQACEKCEFEAEETHDWQSKNEWEWNCSICYKRKFKPQNDQVVVDKSGMHFLKKPNVGIPYNGPR